MKLGCKRYGDLPGVRVGKRGAEPGFVFADAVSVQKRSGKQ